MGVKDVSMSYGSITLEEHLIVTIESKISVVNLQSIKCTQRTTDWMGLVVTLA